MIKSSLSKGSMMQYTYGYARVSTKQQDLIRQLDLLKEYNCTEILTEKMSGTKQIDQNLFD